MSDITFTMIKPDAVSDGHSAEILNMIIKAGFHVAALRLTHLSPGQAGTFYQVHKERPFYNSLVDYMSSAPIIAAVLQKENAVEEFRKLIGATDPANAGEGTIRKRFAKSIESNAVHGSDSNENALAESSFFFPSIEIFKK